MRIKIFFLLYVVFQIYSFANEVDISDKNLTYIGNFTSYKEDKNSTLTIKEIKDLDKKDFKKIKENVHSKFFTNSTIWYKFKLNNHTLKKQERYFVFDLPWIDSINIYIYDPKDTLTKYQLGNTLPFANRSMKIIMLNKKHLFDVGKSTIYLQVKTRDPFVLPFSLLSEKELLEKNFYENTIEFCFYSVVFSMLCFNIILFFLLKDKIYLYYVFFLLSYIMASLTYTGHSFKYILYDYPQIQNWMQSISIYIYGIMAIIFSKYFLKLKEYLPKLNKLTNYVLISYILLFILTALLGYRIHVMSSIVLIFFISLFIMFLSYNSYKKGNKVALFFIIGTIFGLIGTAITAFTVMSFFPYKWSLFRAIDFGIAIDTILISVALANRFSILYKALQNTEKKLINLNENLENSVNERTKELTLELNNKNILLKEISHRVKNNLQIISALFSMELKRIEDKDARTLLEKNISRIKSIANLYENFLNSENLDNVKIKDYIEKIVNDFKNTCTSRDIIYKIDITNITTPNDNLVPLGLIINELITNSIKYAFYATTEPIIAIAIYKEEEKIKVIYKDNGVGIKKDNIKYGFGFKLINTLSTHQLRGNIDFPNTNGFICSIKF